MKSPNLLRVFLPLLLVLIARAQPSEATLKAFVNAVENDWANTGIQQYLAAIDTDAICETALAGNRGLRQIPKRFQGQF